MHNTDSLSQPKFHKLYDITPNLKVSADDRYCEDVCDHIENDTFGMQPFLVFKIYLG